VFLLGVIMWYMYVLHSTVQNLTPTVARCSRVAICRDDSTSSFGFILRGGVNSDLSICRPLMVTHIRSGSAADRCCCHTHGQSLHCSACCQFVSVIKQPWLSGVTQGKPGCNSAETDVGHCKYHTEQPLTLLVYSRKCLSLRWIYPGL